MLVNISLMLEGPAANNLHLPDDLSKTEGISMTSDYKGGHYRDQVNEKSS